MALSVCCLSLKVEAMLLHEADQMSSTECSWVAIGVREVHGFKCTCLH